jgi:hypothetical protein
MILFNETLPIVNKTKHQKKGRKRYKMEAFMPKQKEETTNGCRLQWKHEQIKYSKIIMQGTFKKTLSLEEPSSSLTSCFKVKVIYTCCNAINTLRL